ncbi:MAG TPA: protein kinase [Longimicrobiales bacterium]|nr:protein kinase [Longimicrobiales bacterium]
MAEPVGVPPTLLDLRDEYEIIRELGRGGTAVVYLARERELGRLVAIKVVRPMLVNDEEAVARLAREARTVAQLQHAHIVMLYGTRRLADQSLALIMQYVPGRTVKETIAADGPFSIERAERVLREMAEALAYAHERGIVHRDIKPENIYLDNASGRALLSDFGIARSEYDTSLTLAGVAIGTPAYMSPEQIDGLPVDGRSDLYSLGLVGYEMLTGRRPWEGESLYNIIYKQKHEYLPSLETVRPDVPPRLRRALEGALRKDPAERWQSARDFLAALTPGARWVEPPRPAAKSSERQDASRDAGPAVPAEVDLTHTVRFRPDRLPLVGDPGRAMGGVGDAASVEAPGGAADGGVVVVPTPAPTSAGGAEGTQQALDGPEAVDPKGLPDELQPVLEVLSEAVPVPAGHSGAGAVRSGRARSSRVIHIAVPVLVILLGAAAIVAMLRAPVQEALPLPVEPGRDVPVTERVVLTPIGEDRVDGGAGDGLAPGSSSPDAPADGASAPPVASPESGGGLAQPGTRVSPEGSGRGGARADGEAAGSAGRTATEGTAGAASGAGQAVGEGHAAREVAAGAQGGLGAPARIIAVSGDGQQAAPGSTLASPLVVRVEDREGRPVPGVPVEFRVAYGGGLLSPRTAITNAAGLAETTWTLGAASESSAVIASIGGVVGPQVTFSARVVRPQVTAATRAIVAGGAHSCAVSDDGRVTCWGGNDSGQLGSGDTSHHASPTPVGGELRFVAVAAGVSHSCAVTAEGETYCWGSNQNGQLGDGTNARRLDPVKVPLPEPISIVTAGTAHSCALSRTGAAYCWGANPGGQLGDGTTTDRTLPVAVRGQHAFTAIAAGWNHTCAISREGAAWCWGRNTFGQVGNGTTRDRSTPTRVTGSIRFRSIAAGSAHTCATAEGGRIYCWGQNAFGQLGDGTTDDRHAPIPVVSTESFVSVVAGSAHSCGLTAAGDAYCWGRNNHGQLGDGTNEDRTQPVKVHGGHTFSTLQASAAHTCGLTVIGEEMCWGYNLEGQLGDGTRTNRSTPVRVSRGAARGD